MIGHTKRLNIKMGYTFVGDTGIDIPSELLQGKTEEEQYEIAYEYAKKHIDEIPVATNAEYIPDSDEFSLEDIEFEKKLEIDLKSKDEAVKQLFALAERLLHEAPDENMCTEHENELYAELANIVSLAHTIVKEQVDMEAEYE